MMITMGGSTYKCGWKNWGWSYARITIKVPKSFMNINYLGKWGIDDVLGTDGPFLASAVNIMTHKKMQETFESAIKHQLKYNADWNECCE